MTLLRCGAAAGPLYLTVGFAQAFTREGFDLRVHALSTLANGDLGWIQIMNFLVAGCLVIAGALGVRRALAGTPGGTWGPILLGAYGIGLMGAGTFVADPAPGFPPDSVTPAGMTTKGLLHFVFGGTGFLALIAACFVFSRRFSARRARGWALYSAVTGLAFLVSFAMIASGSTASATMLAFYAAIFWVWAWHCALHLKLMGETHRPEPSLEPESLLTPSR